MINTLRKTVLYTLTTFILLFVFPSPTYATTLIRKSEIAVNAAKSLVPMFIILVTLVGTISLTIYLFEKHHKEDLKQELKSFIFMNFVIISSVLILNIFLSVTIHSLVGILNPGLIEPGSTTKKSELINNLTEFSIPALSLFLPISFTTVYQRRNIESKTKYAYWGIYTLTIVGLITSLIAIFVLSGQTDIGSSYVN